MKDTYRFDDDRKAITFFRHDVPTPWINYLSNGAMHAFVSQAGGGLSWWRTPAIFRLTRYRMYNLPMDSPGFYVYIRPKDGAAWSPTFRPTETPLDRWESSHQPGVTTFVGRRNNVEARLSLWVTPDYDTLVWDLALSNLAPAPVELDLFGYVEFSLHEWMREVQWDCYFKHQLQTWFDPDLGCMFYLYHADHLPRHDDAPLVYFASTLPVKSYDGDRDRFVGPYRYERNPVALERGICQNSRLEGGEPCAALHVPVTVAAGQTLSMAFLLGVSPGALVNFDGARTVAQDAIHALSTPGALDRQRAKLDAWWNEHLSAMWCSIPDKDIERQINIWTPIQSVQTGRYSRSISFSAAGIRGIGFRDTCQDMLAIVYRKPAWATEMFRYQLSQQFADGHVVHASFPEERQRPWSGDTHSDDHLWLPMLAHAIACETGDLSLLSESIPFIADDSSGPSGRRATAWDHLLRAMDFTESHLGAHGIPLTLKSDWNDTIGKFATQGRGESVFAGQQYVYVLRLLRDLARALKDSAAEERLDRFLARQMAALAACAWDGAWWLRGFDDDGKPVGSHTAPWGKLFINPQSWSVLSGSGDPAQLRTAMDAVAEKLNTGMGLQKLWPSFKTYPEVTDPFSGYNEGCGENGAIFCHANTWAIIAEALLGNGQRAWEYFRQLVPHIAMQKVGIERYQAEPYAYASNIVGPENCRFGWANVTQVTGTAAWMDVAGTQYLLGVRAELGGLRVDPCLSPAIKGFTVSRRFRGCRVEIEVKNPNGAQKNVVSILVDGKPIDLRGGPVVPASIIKGKETATVIATLG